MSVTPAALDIHQVFYGQLLLEYDPDYDETSCSCTILTVMAAPPLYNPHCDGSSSSIQSSLWGNIFLQYNLLPDALHLASSSYCILPKRDCYHHTMWYCIPSPHPLPPPLPPPNLPHHHHARWLYLLRVRGKLSSQSGFVSPEVSIRGAVVRSGFVPTIVRIWVYIACDIIFLSVSSNCFVYQGWLL